MTANQLRQVLRLYTGRWYSWVFIVFWLSAVFIPLLFASPRPNEPISEQLCGPLTLSLIANLMPGMLMGLMLRRQFVNTQARLVPGFAAAHLLVAGAIFSVAIAIEAILLPDWGGPVSQLGMVGLVLTAMAAAAWSFYLMHPIGTWLPALLIPVGGYMLPVHGAGLIQVLSDSLILSLALVCVGLGALAALGARLWRLSEEMPEYSRPMPALRWNFRSLAGNRNQQRWEAQAISRSRIQAGLRDVLFRIVLRGPTVLSPCRRLLLRQLTSGFSGLFWMPMQIAIVLWGFWLQGWSSLEPFGAGGAFALMLMPLLMGMGMYGGFWLRRWPYLGCESLLPLGRRDFVRDLTRSRACDITAVAVGNCLGILVGLALFRPQGPLVEMVPLWLVLTVVQYVVAYCLVLWLVSFRSFWIFLLGILPAIYLLPGLSIAVLFAGQGFWGPVTILSAILLTVLVVVLLYRMAFRRWCCVDFG